MNKQCSAARIAALTKHHLDNESPLNEEVKGIEEVKYGEFGRSFPNDGGNGASEDGLSIIATKLGNPLMLESYTSDMCMQSLGRLSYARAMIDLRDDEELKYSIMVAMLKLISEGFNMCTVCVEYEWKPPRCLSCKVFRHVLNECPKKIVSDVVKILNNPRQATRGVPIGPKVSFKSTKQIYKLVSNKNGASTSGKKSKNGSSLTRDDDGNPLVRTACGTIGGKAKWDDDLYTRMMTACMKRAMVRIMQKSQENSQNRTNIDTGMDRVHKSRKFLEKCQQSQLWSSLGQHWSTHEMAKP
ncbi:zinc knuckle CX2CX4HX4C containing protein [Tanacetum coccineum]